MMTTIRSGFSAVLMFLLLSWVFRNRADVQDCMLLLILCYVTDTNYRVSHRK